MNLLAHIPLYASVFLILLTSAVHPQDVPADPNGFSGLDSLLLKGDVQGFLLQWETLRVSARSSPYDLLSNRLRNAAETSEQRLKENCQSLEGLAPGFDAKHVGDKAAALFAKSLDAKSNAAWREALVDYFIAQYFRGQQIQNDKNRLERNASDAESAYRLGEFDAALRGVTAFRSEDRLSPAYLVLGDSLSAIYDDIERKSLTRLFQIQREADATAVGRRLTISFGGGVGLFPARDERDIIMRFDALEFPLGPLPASVTPSYSMQVEYLFTPRFAVSLHANVGSIYDTEAFPSPLGTSRVRIRQNYYTVAIGPSIYMSEKTGLRPSLQVMAGIISVHRDEAKMQSAYWESWHVFAQLDDATTVYPLLNVAVGGEYIPTSRRVSYGMYFSLSYHLGDTQLIRNLMGSVEIRVGVNIL